MARILFLYSILFASLLAVAASPQQIKGDYIETRSADIYVGQCFANGEVGLAGDEAIVAWHIREGKWEGVSLEGLSVVAAIKANATPSASPIRLSLSSSLIVRLHRRKDRH
jgi:hypothetical protein